MSLNFEHEDHIDTIENLRAKINDMLARIASLEDKVRELQYLLDVMEI